MVKLDLGRAAELTNRFHELRDIERSGGILNFTPHIGQAKFMESCFNNRETWAFTGNRWGKTEASLAVIVGMATGEYPAHEYGTGRVLGIRWRHRSGQKFWICAQTSEKLREVIQPKLLRLLPKRFIKPKGIHRQAHDLIDFIELTDGSRIVMKNYAQDVETYEGDDIDGVFFDEQPKWAQYKASMIRLIDRAGHAFGALTPVEGLGWVYREVYKKRDKLGIKCFTGDMDDNPFIAQAEKDSFLAHLTEDEIRVRKEGKFVALHGLIYPMFDSDLHIVEDFKVPSHWVKVTATDPHLKKPMSTVWMTCAGEDCEFNGRKFNRGDHFIYREMKYAGIIPDAVAVFRLAESEFNERIRIRLGDPALNIKTANFSGLNTFAEFARYGWAMQPASKDLNSGVEKVRTRLKVSPPSLYIFRSCYGVMEEFLEYKYKDIGDDPAKNYSDSVLQQYDDYMDPVRYIENSGLLEMAIKDREVANRPIFTKSGRVIGWEEQYIGAR